MAKIPDPSQLLPDLPSTDEGDYGYEWMDRLDAGWHPVADWGLDGWNLGRWPYVIIVARDDAGGGVYACATYVEGDLDIEAFTTIKERDAAIDEIAAFYWRSSGRGPEDLAPEGQPLVPQHRGPFSWERLKAEKP